MGAQNRTSPPAPTSADQHRPHGRQGQVADTKISGIETPDDQTIIFNLEKPTGDFLYRAHAGHRADPEEVAKCFKKAGDYGRYVISSGPYMIQGSDQLDISSCETMKPISGFDPSKELTLVRNPNYDQATDDTWLQLRRRHGPHDQHQRRRHLQQGPSRPARLSIVDQPPKPVLQQYVTDTAKKPYLHSNSGDGPGTSHELATPPFDDIHVRKAANWIMDKAGILQAWGGTTFGDVATHNIPPIVLGDRPGPTVQPLRPPGQQGRRGQGQGGDEAVQVRQQQGRGLRRPECKNLVMINRNTPWTDSEPVVVSSLEKIGIEVKPRELASSAAYTTIQTVKNKIPIALNAGWGKDYADAYTFGPAVRLARDLRAGNNNYPLVGLTPQQAADFGIKLPRASPSRASTPTSTPARRSPSTSRTSATSASPTSTRS